jgi:MFS family permease
MVTGSAIVLLCAAGFVALGGSVVGLVVASVLLGLGHLCSVVGQQAMVANGTAPERYDAGFGHYTFATSVGQATGPALIVFFGGGGTVPNTGAIFAWTAVLTVVLVAVSLALPRTRTRAAMQETSDGSVRDLLRKPGLLRALAVSCVVLAAVDNTLVYLPALGAEREITAGTVGVLLMLRAAASMASRFFLGPLVVLLGRRRLLVGSVALSAVSLGASAIPMPPWLLGVVVALLGLGLGAGQPLTMSWLAETTPPGLTGRAMSLRLTGNRLGQVVVPSLAGMLAVGAGASGVLALTAAGLGAVGFAARRLHNS